VVQLRAFYLMSAAIASIGLFTGKLLVLLVAGSYNYTINTFSVVLAVYFVLGLLKKILGLLSRAALLLAY